jgi:hypothetical protein
MKTQKRNRQSIYRRRCNVRWKWMAGATAATAAGVTASQANATTINLVNNYISAFGGNHLNADLTGDGHPDLTIANAAHGIFYRTTYSGYRYLNLAYAKVDLNGVRASAYFIIRFVICR